MLTKCWSCVSCGIDVWSWTKDVSVISRSKTSLCSGLPVLYADGAVMPSLRALLCSGLLRLLMYITFYASVFDVQTRENRKEPALWFLPSVGFFCRHLFLALTSPLLLTSNNHPFSENNHHTHLPPMCLILTSVNSPIHSVFITCLSLFLPRSGHSPPRTEYQFTQNSSTPIHRGTLVPTRFVRTR